MMAQCNLARHGGVEAIEVSMISMSFLLSSWPLPGSRDFFRRVQHTRRPCRASLGCLPPVALKRLSRVCCMHARGPRACRVSLPPALSPGSNRAAGTSCAAFQPFHSQKAKLFNHFMVQKRRMRRSRARRCFWACSTHLGQGVYPRRAFCLPWCPGGSRRFRRARLRRARFRSPTGAVSVSTSGRSSLTSLTSLTS
jgi:hypothetical protein